MVLGHQIGTQNYSDWPQMGQIRDFFRSDKSRICPIWGQSAPFWTPTWSPSSGCISVNILVSTCCSLQTQHTIDVAYNQLKVICTIFVLFTNTLTCCGVINIATLCYKHCPIVLFNVVLLCYTHYPIVLYTLSCCLIAK